MLYPDVGLVYELPPVKPERPWGGVTPVFGCVFAGGVPVDSSLGRDIQPVKRDHALGFASTGAFEVVVVVGVEYAELYGDGL